MLLVLRYVLVALIAPTRDRRALALESIALRHQVEVLTRGPRRPDLRPGDRLLWSWLSRTWPDWRRHVVIVQPDTVVRWHRTAWRRYWRWKSRGGQRGRPRIEAELAALIRRMSRENPRWGHMRVLGELRKLGYRVSLQTVRRYRQDVPRAPASSWRAFLENHRPQIWAADFFTVHTLGFQTLYVFFFIAHDRRTVMHVHVTAHPTAAWVWRQLINATPWGRGPRYLIRDRDRAYGGDFIARARRIGIETVLTPIATPQANGIAERLIGTLRRECLDHVIVVNERQAPPWPPPALAGGFGDRGLERLQEQIGVLLLEDQRGPQPEHVAVLAGAPHEEAGLPQSIDDHLGAVWVGRFRLPVADPLQAEEEAVPAHVRDRLAALGDRLQARAQMCAHRAHGVDQTLVFDHIEHLWGSKTPSAPARQIGTVHDLIIVPRSVTRVGRLRDGGIEVDGTRYETPSAASAAVRRRASWNGWVDWRYGGQRLADLREQWRQRRASDSSVAPGTDG